ncbi:MAG TPA: MBL fold metallo-hydrolase [Actinospica sp.]|jgi:L-ascorbate metabolism protein UlaG (beta-lactamase superfamily)|nr:MBL fold metallo-hydrolase [Actinospica sp.]
MNDTGRSVRVTTLGAATVLLEYGGLTLLTDPAFDPADTDYTLGPVRLRKTAPTAGTPDQLGPIDAVLLSHDQHPDNLDRAGRQVLAAAGRVLTTPEAAGRLGGDVEALEPWESAELSRPAGEPITVTAIPARHGPVGTEPMTGTVTGFLLSADGLPSVYVSGDNVATEYVDELAERFGGADIAVLHLGAAQLGPFGPALLSWTAEQGAEVAARLKASRVVAVHHEGWDHFTQDRAAILAAFQAAGQADVLVDARPGTAVTLP